MSFNQVTSGERIHIGFFGRRNAGKSSVVNAITGQELSVVSEVKGTTTDPVKKAMELLPLGPVVIIDTPGLDDEGMLGEKRVQKAKQILGQTDIAVLVADATIGLSKLDEELIVLLKERKVPYVVLYNKADLLKERGSCGENELYISALTKEGISALKEKLGTFALNAKSRKMLISDLIEAGDMVVLVTPIDEAAPKGRLILPQQLTVRDILDAHGIVVTCQDTELKQTLQNLGKKPKFVITDSQVFGKVSNDTPEDVMLTSFSVLMARYKGDLETLVKGAATLSLLKDGDKVLISEGCTHHRQCNDIGTVKLPKWVEEFTGIKPEVHFTSGGEFPQDKEQLARYALVIHCGGCTLNEAEMKHRISLCKEADVPIVNYGIAIAHMHGILKRSIMPFEEVKHLIS